MDWVETSGSKQARKMIILAVDTSTLAGSVALLDGEKLMAEATIQHPRKHTERLIPSIEYILDQLGLHVSDIHALAVGVGPGSFTGLRIGISTMKGMALSLNLPLAGVSSLEALARGVMFSGLPVWAVIDARKEQVFAAKYESDGCGNMRRIGEEEVLSPKQLMDRIKDKAVLAGNGAVLYRDFLEAGLGEKAVFAGPGFNHPRAAQVGIMALERIIKGEKDDPDKILPSYIRDADAVIKKKG